MSIDSDPVDSRRYFLKILKGVLVLVFLPLVPIAVVLNINGIADSLSSLPGIEKGGGLVSGLSALVIVSIVVSVALGVATATSSTDIPKIGGDQDSVVTPTKTESALSTPTSTSIATPAVTPTPERSGYQQFKQDYQDRLHETMQNETLTGVPILAMDYREMKNGTTQLWVVYNECDGYEYAMDQRYAIATHFGNTVGASEGKNPDILRVYGVVNLKSHDDITTYIHASSAEAAFDRTMSRRNYTNNWLNRTRDPTKSERQLAFQMAVNESGHSKAERVFTKERPINESDRGCPADAEPADG